MSQADSDSESLQPADFAEQQTLPDDVLEALGLGRLCDFTYLGSGATSSVFSAHDSRLDKRIAIKFLKHADKDGLINFQTEAKLASKLNHNNLVRILNFGVTKKNHAFLIMDFVDGKSLDSIIEEHFRIPTEIAVELLMQVCDGLVHSHSKKIAHRDLKTGNILVQEYGTKNMKAIVVDFGLAQQRESQGQTAGRSSGKIKGSPLFISPEQAQGQPGDERSDIYSLGCVAFYMLTGTLPFESDDLFDLLRMHIETPALSIEEVATDLEFTPALTNCIARMLEKNPVDRFQTIQEVQEALARSTINILPDMPSPVVPKRLRRQIIIPILALSFISIFLVFKLIGSSSNRGPAPTTHAVVESEESKFKRLFKDDTGNFLSHFNYKTVCPKFSETITDDDLECLAHVKLETPNINLAFTHINGRGLASLRSIDGLKLDLTKTMMTSEGFEAIGTLKNLRGLSLEGAQIKGANERGKEGRALSDTELEEVATAGHIYELNVDSCTNVDDDCLYMINSLPLQALSASDAGKITDKGLIALSQCKDLLLVHLDGSQITDKGVEALSSLGTLQDFRANRCRQLTGRSLKMLCEKNPGLKFVGLSFTKITAKDLHYLEGKDLEFIEIPGVHVGPDELRMLGKMHSIKTMYLSNIEDPDSLKYLYGLKKAIRIVFLDSPKLTTEAIQKLQAQLPRCLVAAGEERSVPRYVQDVGDMFIESSQNQNPLARNDVDKSKAESKGLP